MPLGRDRRTLDELILLPEGGATRAHFDDRNAVTFFRWAGLLTVAYLLALMVLVAEAATWRAVLVLVALVLLRAVVIVRDRPVFREHFRAFLYGSLVIQPILVRIAGWMTDHVYGPLDILLPLAVPLFRLSPAPLATVLGSLWMLSAGRDLITASLSEAPLQIGPLLGISALHVVLYLWSQTLTQRQHIDFLSTWRREHQRHRERLRMRGELDEARRLQLSMLPRSEPSTPWLDIAGISIPASEVGGDYYEYFRVSETQQVVVVADVAGHGVASGLLLAGVRSCLYLLKETPLRPAEVLERLHRVVRETTGPREFVTMLYALFDHQTRRVAVAAAGHPPLLRYSSTTGEIDEVGAHSLPLGTNLPRQIEEVEVPFDGDDIFLAVTDGVAETVDGRGNVYGGERLGERLRRTDHARPAKQLRDTLLGDVWTFKADGEQTDDITLVVVKIR